MHTRPIMSCSKTSSEQVKGDGVDTPHEDEVARPEWEGDSDQVRPIGG